MTKGTFTGLLDKESVAKRDAERSERIKGLIEKVDQEFDRLTLIGEMLSEGPPKEKTLIAVEWSDRESRLIYFWTSEDHLVEEFKNFGIVGWVADDNSPDRYRLKVNPQFSFDEVLRYISNFEKVLRVP